MPENKFTTEDYALANWLVFNKCELLGTVRYPNNTYKHFVFLNSDSIPDLVEQWGDSYYTPTTEPAKTCKRFFKAHAIIKKALKDSLDV